jgi:acyl-coenzyme A thioesterase 9
MGMKNETKKKKRRERERKTDATLQGFIRMGRVFEDMDALAGNIAAIHCDRDDKSLHIVTASVDRVVVRHRANLKDDMTLGGHVAWVGRSSMEIHVDIMSSWAERAWLSAKLVFVARDPDTGKSAAIPPVLPESDVEKRIFEECQRRADEAKQKRRASAEKRKAGGGALALLEWPSVELMETARQLVLDGRVHVDLPALAPDNEVLMGATRLSNALICQPQHRNTRGNVFGGFLIRRALELAFTTAYMLAGSQPVLRELDRVDFVRPVRVGDLIRLESCVLYTVCDPSGAAKPLVHVEVVAHITRPEQVSTTVSNVFHFTFEKRDGTPVKRVLPETIEQARRVVQLMHLNAQQELEDL